MGKKRRAVNADPAAEDTAEDRRKRRKDAEIKQSVDEYTVRAAVVLDSFFGNEPFFCPFLSSAKYAAKRCSTSTHRPHPKGTARARARARTRTTWIGKSTLASGTTAGTCPSADACSTTAHGTSSSRTPKASETGSGMESMAGFCDPRASTRVLVCAIIRRPEHCFRSSSGRQGGPAPSRHTFIIYASRVCTIKETGNECQFTIPRQEQEQLSIPIRRWRVPPRGVPALLV